MVGQFKIPANVVAANESMFVLTILEKIRKGLKFSHRTVKLLQRIATFQEAIVQLINTQLNKLKSAVKNM